MGWKKTRCQFWVTIANKRLLTFLFKGCHFSKKKSWYSYLLLASFLLKFQNCQKHQFNGDHATVTTSWLGTWFIFALRWKMELKVKICIFHFCGRKCWFSFLSSYTKSAITLLSFDQIIKIKDIYEISIEWAEEKCQSIAHRTF